MAAQLRLLNFFISFVVFSFGSTDRLKEWKAQKQKINRAQEKIEANWPNGIIPYFLDKNSYDHVIAKRVRLMMNAMESTSCIRFKPIMGNASMITTWLHIANPQIERECMHEPRYKETGEVLLVLGLNCLSEQQVLHTLMHGIGFIDEVSHPQRDQYIRILWNNIQPAYHHLFRIQAEDRTSNIVVEYDPMSVMHFHDRAYSMNGHATIEPLVSGLLINPSEDLSQLDKMKLRMIFGHECKKRNVGDLLDMCKMVLHDNIKQRETLNTTEYGATDNNMIGKETIEEGNGNAIEETDNVSQNEDGLTFNENVTKSNEIITEENDDENLDEMDYGKNNYDKIDNDENT